MSLQDYAFLLIVAIATGNFLYSVIQARRNRQREIEYLRDAMNRELLAKDQQLQNMRNQIKILQQALKVKE